MRGKSFVKAIGILMILAFLGACSSSSTVSAADPVPAPSTGAAVSVNTPAVRQTPAANTTVSNFIGTRSETRVTAESNRPVIVDAVLDINVKPMIGRVFVWPFILWVWDPFANNDENEISVQ